MHTAPLSPEFRQHSLDRMAEDVLDILVVGGGVVGSGCALDAATRGLRVGLVEARDLAAGTSSRSSKLIHGGLRYRRAGPLRARWKASKRWHPKWTQEQREDGYRGWRKAMERTLDWVDVS